MLRCWGLPLQAQRDERCPLPARCLALLSSPPRPSLAPHCYLPLSSSALLRPRFEIVMRRAPFTPFCSLHSIVLLCASIHYIHVPLLPHLRLPFPHLTSAPPTAKPVAAFDSIRGYGPSLSRHAAMESNDAANIRSCNGQCSTAVHRQQRSEWPLKQPTHSLLFCLRVTAAEQHIHRHTRAVFEQHRQRSNHCGEHRYEQQSRCAGVGRTIQQSLPDQLGSRSHRAAVSRHPQGQGRWSLCVRSNLVLLRRELCV